MAPDLATNVGSFILYYSLASISTSFIFSRKALILFIGQLAVSPECQRPPVTHIPVNALYEDEDLLPCSACARLAIDDGFSQELL